MRDSSVVRFAGSLGVAFCIVLAMLLFGLEISGFMEHDDGPVLETHDVSLLTESERLDLQELLGVGRYGLAPPSSPVPVAAPPPRAESRGFVRLDVRVDALGNVADVRVIDANPPGIYEAQAVAEVSRRQYPPDVVDGVAVASRHLEIVDFTVSPVADEPVRRE